MFSLAFESVILTETPSLRSREKMLLVSMVVLSPTHWCESGKAEVWSITEHPKGPSE